MHNILKSPLQRSCQIITRASFDAEKTELTQTESGSGIRVLKSAKGRGDLGPCVGKTEQTDW